ncbi:MAG: SBBP repeat-containing protein [Bacteroidota bacterium]
MKKLYISWSVIVILISAKATISFATGIKKPVSSQPACLSNGTVMSGRYGFIENKGQIIDQNNNPNPSVLYLYNGNPADRSFNGGGGLHVQLKQSGFSYEVSPSKSPRRGDFVSTIPNVDGSVPPLGDRGLDSIYIHRIDISFVNANPNATITASDIAPDYINYYTTGTSEKGVTQVHHCKKVLYQNIYNNIDVEFCLSDGSSSPSGRLGGAFKYNFIVHPGGNVNDIQLKFDGANSTSLTKDGHIKIETAYGNIDESIPFSYQINSDNSKQSITSSFINSSPSGSLPAGQAGLGGAIYGIGVYTYDASKTLIIDPLPWGTYFGGLGGDWGYGIISDIDGFVLVTGETNSASSIATSGAYQSILAGSTDAFIVKFNPSGGVQWATYYGGSGGERATGIAVDSLKCIYVTGQTSSLSDIATTGSYQNSCSSCPSIFDAFLAKFDSAGMLQWGTYFGGPGGEIAYGIAIDPKRNVIITGYTNSALGIATTGSYMSSLGGNTDAFVSRFSTSGSMLWSTYFGSSLNDIGFGIATDSGGNIYVTGRTNSTTGIASIGAYQTVYGGGYYDAFLVQFDSLGNKHWSTYYGVDQRDIGLAVTTDYRGDVLFTGYTNSGAMIASGGAHQTIYGGGGSSYGDAMIVKFTSLGARVWATYYGGSGEDEALGIATDAIGNVYVAGSTTSSTAIATAGTSGSSFSGGANSDAFIVKLNTNGIRQWGTYYGGTQIDDAQSIAVSNTGNILVTGRTYSTTGIAFGTVYQNIYGGNQDAFVASFTSYGGLPVQLINFDAQLVGNREQGLGVSKVLCTWQTASELNNDYFEIERSFEPTANSQWLTAGIVKGNGTTNNSSNYTYSDNLNTLTLSNLNTIYYRLKQVDFDGKSSFSEVRVINLGKDINTCSVYPNPNTGTFTINFNNTQGEKQIAIYNLQGKLVAHYTTKEIAYEVQEQLAHGMYFIKAENPQGTFNTKFVVE